MKPPSLPFPLSKPTWPQGVARPAPERKTGINYDHEWSRRYPARLARAVMMDNVTRPLAKAVAPATTRGEEHLAHLSSPVIFAANHASHVDTPLLLTTLPTRFRHHTVVAAASDYFFDRRWKAFLWSLSLAAIPIDRSRISRRSIDMAAELLEDGWNLVIFPEGGRSPDGWTQPFHPASAAYLSRRTKRPVVPVYVHGTRHVLPKSGGGSRPLRRSPVSVLYGPALSADEGEDVRRFGARIETAVATLADEVTTDWWTARRRAAAGDTPSARGPEAAPWRRAWALDPPPDTSRPPWPR